MDTNPRDTRRSFPGSTTSRRPPRRLAELTAMLAAVLTMLVSTVLPIPAHTQLADVPVQRPLISENAVPVQAIAPMASDGHRGKGYLRKPPGEGPFPAVVLLHAHMIEFPDDRIRRFAADDILPARLLAAGYVVAVMNYRSRDTDPQLAAPVLDSIAAAHFVRDLSYVDKRSVAVMGCSGGGDLAIQVAASKGARVAAVVAEDPATMMFTGTFNNDTPKKGRLFDPSDSRPIISDPLKFYTPQLRARTEARARDIRAPILVMHEVLTRYNEQAFLPALKAANREYEVRSYPGQPHCLLEGTLSTPAGVQASVDQRAAAGAYEDAEAFIRRNVRVKPIALAATLVEWQIAEALHYPPLIHEVD